MKPKAWQRHLLPNFVNILTSPLYLENVVFMQLGHGGFRRVKMIFFVKGGRAYKPPHLSKDKILSGEKQGKYLLCVGTT